MALCKIFGARGYELPAATEKALNSMAHFERSRDYSVVFPGSTYHGDRIAELQRAWFRKHGVAWTTVAAIEESEGKNITRPLPGVNGPVRNLVKKCNNFTRKFVFSRDKLLSGVESVFRARNKRQRLLHLKKQ